MTGLELWGRRNFGDGSKSSKSQMMANGTFRTVPKVPPLYEGICAAGRRINNGCTITIMKGDPHESAGALFRWPG
jgi:hypothetical protein